MIDDSENITGNLAARGPRPATAVNDRDAQNWDLVITPYASVFQVPVFDIWRYRDLLYLFVRRDFVAFYKQTIFGPIWFFVQPILTTLIYMLVFGRIAGLSTDGLPQVLFYLSGVTFWNYFAECFNKTATVFKDNAQLFGKVYFPRMIVPLSLVASGLMRFGIQFGLFLVIFAYHAMRGTIQPNAVILLFPILLLIMATLSLGLGMLFSALTTKYRDLVFLLQFGVQLMMYATPVIYPLSQVPENVRALISWNPLTPIMECVRYGFLGAGTFTTLGLIYSSCFAVAVFVVATAVFNQVERTFMDTV